MNKAADGGITALHMAALNGLFDCVQLLLDLEANVSAVTFHYGTSMDMIGPALYPPSFFLTNGFFLYFSQDDNFVLRYCFRSRKHAFTLCCLWWEFEMLSGKNNTTKFILFVLVVWRQSCENLHFMCFSIDSACKRCKKDDIELQRVSYSITILLCFVSCSKPVSGKYLTLLE